MFVPPHRRALWNACMSRTFLERDAQKLSFTKDFGIARLALRLLPKSPKKGGERPSPLASAFQRASSIMSRVLCVQPIESDVASEALIEAFSFHGKIERLARVPSEQCCFIEFSSDAAVRSALMLDRTLLPCAKQKVDVDTIPEADVPDASFWRSFAVPLPSSDSSDEGFEKIELPEESSHDAIPSPEPDASTSADDHTETSRRAVRADALRAMQKQPINRMPALLGVALVTELVLISICS